MHDQNTRQVASTSRPRPRSELGNAFRGLLLVVDVGVGGLMLNGGRLAIFDIGSILFMGLALVVLGLWLVASGILLVVIKRPKCWAIGTWSHAIAGLGYFVLVAVTNATQLPPERDQGHPGAIAIDMMLIISIVCAVLGIMWFIAAALIFAFWIGERRNKKPAHFVSDIIEHSEGTS